MKFSSLKIDWSPFTICAPGEKAPYPRALTTVEGLGDRLRFVAFAELQAVHAFSAAAHLYADTPPAARELWLTLSREEEKHFQLLIARMKELGVEPSERPQSLALWQSFDRCNTAREFAVFMAKAEDRGRHAGEQFYETLLKIDLVTAELFKRIAEEEKEHIRLAASVMNLL